MGLYASFSPETFGLPLTLSQAIGEEVVEVEVDYSEACEAFCEVFEDVATDLVPVDTGYLQSTIWAETDGFFCEASADAEYAQYVEYGTWKMAAQPYFQPALAEGLQAFAELAEEALDEASEMLQDLCEEVLETMAEAMGEEMGFFGEMGGMLMGALLLLLLFPLLVYIYGIMDTIFGNDNKSVGGISPVGVEILIT